MRRLAITSVVIILAWLLLSFTVLPPYAITPGENPVTLSPEDVDLAYTSITVPVDGIELEGWWMPAPSARAVLLFVHGAGSNRTSWFIQSLDLYRLLVDQQISVLTVDLRNHGNSPKTDGRLQMGAIEWRDVMAMANWLDASPQRDLPRIAMGASMGGATVIHALSQGLQVDGVILFDPALDTQDALAQGGWVQTGIPTLLLKPFAWATTTFWGLPSGQHDALAKALQIAQPTLLIQDPDDPVTRLTFAEQLGAANPQMALAVAPTTTKTADCLTGKNRWGSHVAAFSCHPEWFNNQLVGYLNAAISSARGRPKAGQI